MQTHQTILTPPLSCKYGAPMGRHPQHSADHGERIYCRKIPLDAGGYDRGGAYWGRRPRGFDLYGVYTMQGAVAYIDGTSRADALAEYNRLYK